MSCNSNSFSVDPIRCFIVEIIKLRVGFAHKMNGYKYYVPTIFARVHIGMLLNMIQQQQQQQQPNEKKDSCFLCTFVSFFIVYSSFACVHGMGLCAFYDCHVHDWVCVCVCAYTEMFRNLQFTRNINSMNFMYIISTICTKNTVSHLYKTISQTLSLAASCLRSNAKHTNVMFVYE